MQTHPIAPRLQPPSAMDKLSMSLDDMITKGKGKGENRFGAERKEPSDQRDQSTRREEDGRRRDDRRRSRSPRKRDSDRGQDDRCKNDRDKDHRGKDDRPARREEHDQRRDRGGERDDERQPGKRGHRGGGGSCGSEKGDAAFNRGSAAAARGATPRLNAKQLNSLFSHQPKEELETLFLEFSAFPDFLNEMHIGNLWNKLGKQLNTGPQLPKYARENNVGWFDRRRRFRDGLVELTMQDCHKYGGRTLANIIHGAANSRLRNRATLDMAAECARHTTKRLRECDVQNICNALWGLATIGSDDAAPQSATLFERKEVQELFTAVEEECLEKVSSPSNPNIAQNVSNLLWAYAKAGF